MRMKRRHVASMDEVRITREGEYAVIEFADWWRITDMEIWDEEARDLLGPAYIEFGSDDMGEFRFIAVQGRMDCRFGRKDAKPLVKFSWQSSDEMDEASGRGWAVIEGSGELKGRIFFHQGDDSAFTATRGDSKATSARRAPRPI